MLKYKIFNKNVIFANNNSYLTFGEIDKKNKGFFTFEDFQNANSVFGQEGLSELFDKLKTYKQSISNLPQLTLKLKAKITKTEWLEYIRQENPYNIGSKTEHHSCWPKCPSKITIPWQDRLHIKSHETNRIFDKNNILIVQPKTYKSAVLYGYDTKWCYASASTDEHYNDAKNAFSFFIIFNRKRKNKPYYKFMLTVNKETGFWFFEDQKNRLLTNKIIYDCNMNTLEENSLKHLNFLHLNLSAMEKLECSTNSKSQHD